MSDIWCLFFDIFAVWDDVVSTQDIAFALLDDPISRQALSHDIFWIASVGVVFLPVSVFPVSSSCEVSASQVSPLEL